MSVRIFTVAALLFLSMLLISYIASIYISNAPTFKKYNISTIKSTEAASLIRVTDDIVVSTGDYPDICKVNMALIIEGSEAILIDTGYKNQEADLIRQFVSENGIEIKSIIMTHLSRDHVGNFKELSKGIPKTYEFSNIEDGQIIQLGDKKLKIIVTKGHYKNHHISVEIMKDNILVAGDVVVSCYLPMVNPGVNITDLIATLESIKQKEYSLIIPGHGDIIDPKISVERSLEYLYNLKRIVIEKIEAGGTIEEIRQIEVADCLEDITHLDARHIDRIHQLNLEGMYEFFSQESE
ncbi:MAG: MBL fold metallo-hydrolase [Bacillota bacterium]